MNRGAWILLVVLSCAALAATAAPRPNAPAKGTAAPPTGAPPAQPVARALPPLATVNGDAIDPRDFETLLRSYLQQAQATAAQRKDKFGKTEARIVAANVLGGLINDRIWVQEARRSGIRVDTASVDARIKGDPFFITNGKFDAAKWQMFKVSPQSNYPDVYRRAHDIVMVDKLREALEKRFAPTEAEVRAEYLRQNERHRIRYVWMREDKSLLEPAPGRAEVEAYYNSHLEEFRVAEKIDLMFACYRVGTPHDTSWEQSRAHAEELLARLRQGAALDSVSAAGAAQLNTGPTERGQTMPMLKHGPSLTDSLFRLAPKQPYERVVLGSEGYGVLVLGQRHEAYVRPLREAWAASFRSAQLVHKKQDDERAQLAQYNATPARYRVPSARVQLLYFDPRVLTPQAPPGRPALEALYREKQAAFTAPDSSGAPRTRTFAEVESLLVRMYPDWMGDSLAAAAAREALGRALKGKDVFSKPPAGAVLREFLHVLPTTDDSLLTPTVIDSFLVTPAGGVKSVYAALRGRLVFRIMERDTAYLPPPDAIRDRLRYDVEEGRKARREAAAKAYYEAHRGEFKGENQYVLQYFMLPSVDQSELNLSDSDLQAYYRAHIRDYTSEGRVRLQLAVFNLRPDARPEDARRVIARADSMVMLARRGEDFGQLVVRYSEDRATAARGGDVGFLTRATLGDTAVARVAFGMK
ncbi:MAG: SurA N-terminal domain-containing protein [Candidatus Eisenbacteria bacterium]|nr:SurA N-terminal domain-containing protein [Candidatus Eisenbacteria bacterium]